MKIGEKLPLAVPILKHAGTYICTNRGSEIWKGAARIVKEELEEFDFSQPVLDALLDRRTRTVVSYIDTSVSPHKRKNKNERPHCDMRNFYIEDDTGRCEHPTIVGLIPKKISAYIANKRVFGEKMTRLGKDEISPRSFNSIEDALAALKDPKFMDVKLVFIKAVHLAAGAGIEAVKVENLAGRKLGRHEIIQFGVTDMQLYENKKIVIRAYLLVMGGKMFLHTAAYVIQHGQDFDPTSEDYNTQINHKGSKVSWLPLSDTQINHAELIAAIAHASRLAYPVIKPIIDGSTENTFVILGPDFVPRNDGSVQFIEINAMPNLVHPKRVSERVDQLMLASVIKMAFGMENDPNLIPITPYPTTTREHDEL